MEVAEGIVLSEMPGGLVVVGVFLLIAAILSRINYLAIVNDTGEQVRILLALLVLMLLWKIRAPVSSDSVHVHFLGMTALTLMFDFPLAVLMGGLVACLNTSVGQEIEVFPLLVNVLCLVVVPAAVTSVILKAERHAGFRLFFSYIYLCGFFGGAVSIAASIWAEVLLWSLMGVSEIEASLRAIAEYTPLFMLSEAVINGMVVAGLVVFSPQALHTLDEHRYAGH